MKKLTTIKMSAVGILIAMSLQASAQNAPVRTSYAPYFTEAKAGAKAPDADGFIQRWLLLEPIKNSLRSNAGFTEEYIRGEVYTDYFPNQFTVVPKNGDKVTVNDVELKWHALDATNFNAKLFRFAGMVEKDVYGVTFWAVTVIDCPEEIKDVRMAVGSNSASMWWVNGEEEVCLFGDRRMVMDDCVSERLTLKKGVNIIRGFVINGPGMSDMCVRFIDDAGNPIKNYTINLGKAGN
ncbi:MAG: acetylxylan esterase [Lentisphaerae bacterium]|nr:acetylxylan esterase [Lentisphaerota bacterium]